MDKWLKSPWVTRGISLVLAVLLYITVAIDEANSQTPSNTLLPSSSTDVATINDVPLQVSMNDEEYVVQGVPDTVDVSIEGPKSVVMQTARQRDFEVFVDLNEFGEGAHEVDLQHTGLSNQLTVYIEPESIEIVLEERATATYPLDKEYIGQGEADVTEVFAEEPTIEPTEVEITGARSEVDKVATVRALINFEELEAEGQVDNIPIRVYDSQGNELNVFVNPTTATVQADVSIRDRRYPIRYETTGELDEGLVLQSITLNPVSATLFARDERLDEISSLDPLEINLSEITESTTLEMDIPRPSNTSKIEPETVEVEITVQEAEDEVFEEMQIEIENAAEESEIEFLDREEPVIDVTVIGTEEDLNELSREDIRVWIDVSEYVEGEVFAPIQLEGPDNIRLRTEDERIRIRIQSES